MNWDAIVMIIRLGVGAVATFAAILLWSQTRSVAWMWAILGVIFRYGWILFQTLLFFGVVGQPPLWFGVFPAGQVFLENAPLVFLAIAFFTAVASKDKG